MKIILQYPPENKPGLGGDDRAALPGIIASLKSAGYAFVTVTALLAEKK
jgi:peptidoglycan/xylan/chitin deacetylase (PgdA/CDA1 family)